MELSDILQTILKSKSILIVDDEEKIRDLLVKYLTKAKCSEAHIVHAADGAEALRKISNQEFGLIIVDIVLPKKNGLELFKEIRSRARTRNIPVLIVSGNLHANVVKQAIVLGAKHILSKPFNYNIFIERVGKCLGVAS